MSKIIKTKKTAVKKPKETLVTYEFLMNLANKIYDPKTKRFLRLCRGDLQSANVHKKTNENICIAALESFSMQ